MPVNEQIVDSVASANLKTLGDGPAFYSNQAFANSVSHQNRLNILAETALAAGIKALTTISPEQSISVNKVMTGNDLAQQIAQLLAALSSNQQGAKVAQTTPPVTPPPTPAK